MTTNKERAAALRKAASLVAEARRSLDLSTVSCGDCQRTSWVHYGHTLLGNRLGGLPSKLRRIAVSVEAGVFDNPEAGSS